MPGPDGRESPSEGAERDRLAYRERMAQELREAAVRQHRRRAARALVTIPLDVFLATVFVQATAGDRSWPVRLTIGLMVYGWQSSSRR